MRTILGSTIALFAVVAIAGEAAAKSDCRSVEFGGRDVSYCQEVCRTVPLNDWLARWDQRPRRPPSPPGVRPEHPPEPARAGPRPLRITSCKASATAGGCRITACGPVPTRYDVLRTRNTDAIGNRVLTPKPKVGPPGPGLMEADQGGFVRQAPSATGTPLKSGAPSGGGSPAGGGGLR
jgi:hypothetical protein